MKVSIYGTTHCAFCKTLKQWLDSKNVAYQYTNLDEDEAARTFMELTMDVSRVPITMITEGENTKMFVGFDRMAISSALGI